VSSTSLSAEHSPSRRLASAPDGAAVERQLARWIAEGDEAALAELFDLTGSTLYALAYGICQNPRQAAGAVEETFAELWDKRASLGRLPAVSPWLLERCRTWALALRSGDHVPPAKPLQDRAGDVPLTRRLLRCPEQLRTTRVRAALERLDERQREAVALAAWAGNSIAEISEQLGLAPQEVQRLISQGLRSVRTELEHTLRRETL
jgi:RNA polymerase sigma-70 factor (ECF subfamily)